MTRAWNKQGLDAFRDGLSLSRREDDARLIERLFRDAPKSPLLQEALEWAFAHKVDFIIDRNLDLAGGVYHSGTGVLALSQEMFKPGNRDEAFSSLVHEIRHAWQDWNALLPTYAENFTEAYIRQSALEADADAFGKLAAKQISLAKDIARIGERKNEGGDIDEKNFEELKIAFNTTLEKTGAALWEAFSSWYTTPYIPLSYGLGLARGMAKEMGRMDIVDSIDDHPLGAALAGQKSEFSLYRGDIDRPRSRGVDVGSRAGLAPLGQGFSGTGNYFDAAPAGYLEKEILAAAPARALYGEKDKINWFVALVLEAEKKAAPEKRAVKDVPPPSVPLDPAREKARLEREKNRTTRKRSAPAFERFR